jgi:hypothetical protein
MEVRTLARNFSRSADEPVSIAVRAAVTSEEPVRRPAWVVRIRSVLRFIASPV